MKINDLKILDERESTNMTGGWTEYLCIEKLPKKKFELTIRGFEILGNAENYYNEEMEEYEFPDQIDGKDIVGTADEYVIGGNLVIHSEADGRVEFSDPRNI